MAILVSHRLGPNPTLDQKKPRQFENVCGKRFTSTYHILVGDLSKMSVPVVFSGHYGFPHHSRTNSLYTSELS